MCVCVWAVAAICSKIAGNKRGYANREKLSLYKHIANKQASRQGANVKQKRKQLFLMKQNSLFAIGRLGS